MIGFIHPSNHFIVGPSGSGKTMFVLSVIKKKLLKPFPDKIYYLYNIEQDFMKNFPEIEFVQGLDLKIIDKVDEKLNKLLIIDDLMLEMNKELGEQFIYRTRHKNCSTMFLAHTLFMNKDIHRLISNNSHYFVIFGNRRQLSNVRTLGNQLGIRDRVLEGYKYACEKPFGFIVVSCHPLVPDFLAVTSDNFEEWPSVFL